MNSLLRYLHSIMASREEEPSQLAVRLCQLEDWKRGRRPLSDGELRYWSMRFRDRRIEALLGCAFESYLQRPIYYERLARSRQIIAERRADGHVRHRRSAHTQEQPSTTQ